MKTPKYKSGVVEYTFSDGDKKRVSFIESTARVIMQYAAMAQCDDPILRARGKERMKEAAALVAAGELYLRERQNAGRQPRGTIENDDGEKLTIKALAARLREQYPDYKPAELWPHFVSELDRRSLNPSEGLKISPRGESIPAVTFDAPTKKDPTNRKEMTLRAFGATLAKLNP